MKHKERKSISAPARMPVYWYQDVIPFDRTAIRAQIKEVNEHRSQLHAWMKVAPSPKARHLTFKALRAASLRIDALRYVRDNMPALAS